MASGGWKRDGEHENKEGALSRCVSGRTVDRSGDRLGRRVRLGRELIRTGIQAQGGLLEHPGT